MIVHDAFRNFVRTPTGLILSEDAARLRYAPKRHPLGGDVFSGCGGASLGMKQAGFHIVFAVELWTTAAITYMVNLGAYPCKIHFETEKLRAEFEKQIVHKNKKTGLETVSRAGTGWIAHNPDIPGTDHMWIWDVAKLTGKQLLGEAGLQAGDLDVLHGSPPCQGFSVSGKKDKDDPRNLLMLEYARLITELRPSAFTLEQVPNVLNMTTADGQPMMDAFFEALEAGGYATRRALEKMIDAQGGKAMLMHRGRDRAKGKKAKPAKQSHVERATPSPIAETLARLRAAQSSSVTVALGDRP